MNDKADLLATLRDIQEPIAPASSSAWLVALVAILLLLAFVSVLIYWYQIRQKRLRSLRHEIKSIRALPPRQALHELAVLLRRVMYQLHGDSINQVQGKHWLANLNTAFSTNYFEHDRGQVFGDYLYQDNSTEDDDLPDTERLCDDISYLLGRLKLSS